MSLTQEQRLERRRGIGGSEIAPVAWLHPYRGPLSVWATKSRGPSGELAPIIDESDDEENLRAEVGHALEAGLRALYSKRTGIEVVAAPTLWHESIPWALATPDALAVSEDRGCEIKVVGSRMAHHWAEESIPDYVRLQACWGMAVTGRGAWDVSALIGGTDFRIWTVRRDPELNDMLLEAGRLFWEDHVVADVPPPPLQASEAKAYLRARYPGSTYTKCRSVGDNATAATLVAQLLETKRVRKEAEELEQSLTNALCDMVGDDYGIEGQSWRFTWAPSRGYPRWREIAEALAGGAVPADLIDAHRGEDGRTARLTSRKERSR